MSQNKYIENIKSKVQKKIDKLRDDAQTEYLNWADTGYQRYWKKKERLENEADELESFINPGLEVKRAWRKANAESDEKEKLKILLKRVQNVLEEEMKYDFPDSHATRRLEDIVNEFKFDHADK